jgi:hypothetical protein
MTTAKLACSYYLLGVSIFALGFFAILLILEVTESEYLRVHYHPTEPGSSKVFNLLMAMIVYSAIVILLWRYIHALNNEGLHKTYKERSPK